MMHHRQTLASLAVLTGLALGLAGCEQVGTLKARMAFKDANAFYSQQDYRRAAEKYEESLQHDPELTVAYFYLANSYDNLYRPGRQGEPENDRYLEKAIENYRIAIDRETDPKMKRLAIEYLVAAYAPDKLNDPDQAEPLVQQLIDMDSGDPTNYFALSTLYENAGRYDEAEETLHRAREVRPQDPAVYLQLAAFYNRQGEFEKTIEALEQRAEMQPDNPEAYYTIATYYWDKAFRDARLPEPVKREYIMEGIGAADRALQLKNDYEDAMVYKNILLRMQANLEKDRSKQEALIKEADQLRDRAQELRKQRTAGVG
jgi:tetratricopeptide (TPR) repeat protein